MVVSGATPVQTLLHTSHTAVSGHQGWMIALPERSTALSFVDRFPQHFQLVSARTAIPCYQLFIVEQWVPDRSRITKTVTAYTGDRDHKVFMTVLNVLHPNQPLEEWTAFMKHLESDRARPMDTPNGKVLVTNLSTFSSLLNLIQVPDGDYELHKAMFHLNFNLRRLACSGRSALNLQTPSGAHKDRFRQIYKTADAANFNQSVFDLVRLIQCCLYVLSLLDKSWMDGLLCDATCEALERFTEESGPFETEVNGSACDPPLLAGLLSKVLSLRNRIHGLGTPCPKNPLMEIDLFINSIAQFQKSNKLDPSGFLDSNTIARIEELDTRPSPPAKKKVFKSSKTEDAAAGHSSNAETTDLDVVLKQFYVESFKTIWAKPKKNATTTVDVLLESANLAEDLIQGGKEFLKKASRLPAGNRDSSGSQLGQPAASSVINVPGQVTGVGGPSNAGGSGSNVMKGLRDNVVGGFSRISNSVEGFRERRKVVKSKTAMSPSIEARHGLPGSSPNSTKKEMSARSLSAEMDDVAPSMSWPTFDQQHQQPLKISRRRHYSLSEIEGWDMERCELKRSPSLQFMEDYVIDDPGDVSALFNRLRQEEIIMVQRIDELKNVALDFDGQLQILSDLYYAHWQEFSEIEGILNGLIDEQKSIAQQILLLETNASKMNYDLSVLQDKNREADELMDNFKRKVDTLNVQVTQGLKRAKQYDVMAIIKALWNKLTLQGDTGDDEPVLGIPGSSSFTASTSMASAPS